MVLSEVKSWFLTHVVMILGVALALTVGYVAWLRLVSIPGLKKDVEVAQANEQAAKANTQTCLGANASLSASVDNANRSIKTLAEEGQRTRQDTEAILMALGSVGRDVRKNLGGFKPNPNKSDCDNAKEELAKFKAALRP